jgi:hypothetical protein
MLGMADFDSASENKMPVIPEFSYRNTCEPPECFIGSYAPVTPAGKTGPFHVNTYFLRNDRRSELAGPVPVRSNKFKNCN